MVNHTADQSRLESAIEVTFNLVLGIILALLTWNYIIIPNPDFYEVYRTAGQTGMAVTLTFTGISFIRGMFSRRIFATKLIHRFVGWIFSKPGFIHLLEWSEALINKTVNKFKQGK